MLVLVTYAHNDDSNQQAQLPSGTRDLSLGQAPHLHLFFVSGETEDALSLHSHISTYICKTHDMSLQINGLRELYFNLIDYFFNIIEKCFSSSRMY